MELIGAHQILGLLGDHPVLRRQQLRTHRRVQDVIKDILQFFVAAGIRVIPYQVADQRLGDRCVHPVHGHMVSVVGGPAQGQLRHIAGADDHSSVFIGQIHQDLGPLPGLGIFIGHVMVVHTVAQIPEVDCHSLFDADLLKLCSQLFRKKAGILIGPVCGPEAGHGHRKDLFPGDLKHIKGPGRHQKGQRGIQSAGDPHHCLGTARVGQPFFQSQRLDR